VWVFSADKLFIAGNALTASNMYAYCNGNPMMWVDVSGAKAEWVLADEFSVVNQGGNMLGLSEVGVPAGISVELMAVEPVLSVLSAPVQAAADEPTPLEKIGLVFLLIVGTIMEALEKIKGIFSIFSSIGSLFITRSKEKAEDYRLQDACFALLAGNYSSAKWALCTTEAKRKTFLTELFEKVQGIMKTTINATIVWDDNAIGRGAYVGHIKSGFSDPNENQIIINLDYVTEGIYDIVYTVIHEVRHAYQQEAVLNKNKHVVTSTTKGWWAKRFPISWQGSKEPYYSIGDSERYAQQSIEWDAHYFAKQEDNIKISGRVVTPEYAGSWPRA